MIKRLNVPEAPPAVGPYSHGSIVGDILYSSGIIPLDPKTHEIVPGGIEAQTKRVLENLQIVLSAVGQDYSSVIKNTIFIVDMNDFDKINSLYSECFSGSKPARSCVEVSKLPKGALIEMESIIALK